MDLELKDVIQITKKAGQKVMEIYGREYKSYQKNDKSPVTEADLASERTILPTLKKYNYGILSEETEDDLSRLRKDKIWIIDPLDGTNDFLQKTGEFSIMVGLAYKGKPLLGVVYLPVEDKLYFAKKGEGAFLKKGDGSLQKLKVSDVSSFPESKFVVSRTHLRKKEKKFLKDNKTDFIQKGSTGIKLGFIAEGKAEGYISMSDKTCQWDICAPEIILTEAGGRVTNLKDENFIYNRKETRNLRGIIASNKKIHHQILNKLIA